MNDSNLSISQKIKKKGLEHLSTTSWHGFPYIVNSHNPLQKFLWLIVMLLMMAYASFNIATNVLEYQGYPVVTNINSVYQAETQFPAVQFCYFDRRYEIYCSFEGAECQPINLLTMNKVCESFNNGLKKNISYYPIDVLT